MNTEKNQLIEEITRIIRNTEDFVIEQAPDIIEQILNYQLFVNIFIASIPIIVLLVFKLISIRLPKSENRGFSFLGTKKIDPMYDEIFIPYIVFQIVSAVIGCIGIVHVYKIIFAPKLFLLEYLTKLM